MKELLTLPPTEFVSFLRENRISRFYLTTNPQTKRTEVSHPLLQEVADVFLKNDRDFHGHEGVFVGVSKRHNILYGAFIHKTCRGQAQGGTRLWFYDKTEDFFRDGLRLSEGMTYKNALAGLWWGGGKGVISRDPNLSLDPQKNPEAQKTREEIFKEYGQFVTSLRGCYITAEDVGTTTEDMTHIFSQTRFITCIPQEVGGSGNPSAATAQGTLRGMQAAVYFLDGGTLENRTVAVQGAGHVGFPLIRMLFENNVKAVLVTDIDEKNIQKLKNNFKDNHLEAAVVERGDQSILSAECDILAPCATGAILNSKTIPHIKARIVCGAANNQLEDLQKDGLSLFEKGILYVPDFLVNRMGIVNCANEQYGYLNSDPFFERHLGMEWNQSVYQTTLNVLQASRENKKPPGVVAVEFAQKLSQELHPIFGHRGQQIIHSLLASHWEKND